MTNAKNITPKYVKPLSNEEWKKRFDEMQKQTFARVKGKPLEPTIPAREYIGKSERDVSALIEMLQYRRMAGTKTIRNFEKRYLQPVFGSPDAFGNYFLEIGKPGNSRIAFMAHFDSVHRMGGKQKLAIKNEWIMLHRDETQSNCLGADCATGMWLIMEMIKSGVPGIYIIHADEESGCQGSRKLVKANPDWLDRIDFAISFDRKGINSVITEQSGGMTASDTFAHSMAAILDLEYEPDPTGSYTDSNEYADVVAECTNLSVGYYQQHTRMEIQDLRFAALLADRLISADWSKLIVAREPGDSGWNDYRYGTGFRDRWDIPNPADYRNSQDSFRDMVDLIQDYPEAIADILEQEGMDAERLAEIIEASMGGSLNRRGI